MDGNLGPRLKTLMNFKIHQGMTKLWTRPYFCPLTSVSLPTELVT